LLAVVVDLGILTDRVLPSVLFVIDEPLGRLCRQVYPLSRLLKLTAVVKTKLLPLMSAVPLLADNVLVPRKPPPDFAFLASVSSCLALLSAA
jgi:hypothetical protein